MKFNVSAALVTLASFAAATTVPQRRGCAEAQRFGDITVTPTTANPGDNITISVDLSCSSYFGIVPVYLDYTLAVPEPSNNGYEAPIVLARRNYEAGSNLDEFTVEIPVYSYFPGASYTVVLTNTHYTTSSPVLVEGGVYGAAVLTTSSD